MEPLPEPALSRPPFPARYGVAADREGLVPWEATEQRLRESLDYWVATTTPDGSPHVVPVWGLWLDDGLHFGTAPETRMGRNLARNDRVVVHLESGDDVVILKGRVTPESPDARLAAASKAKYGFGPDPDEPSSEGTYLFRPRRGYAWRVANMGRTATRYDFDRRSE
jgi:hypothetical protein